MGHDLSTQRQHLVEAVHECLAPDKPGIVFEFEKAEWFIPEVAAGDYYKRIRKCIEENPGKNPFHQRGIHHLTIPTGTGPVTLKT